LRITRDVIAVILDHARGCLPDECCGLLLGRGNRVGLAWPARNELASPTRYRVDPRDYLAAARYGRRHGLDVVGAYHSHPASPAVPSPTDLAESAGEDFVYLIAGRLTSASGEGDVRAYRFAGGNFAALRLVTDSQENLS
jgi:proteasome lid subunit RPN8/RPN11